MPSYKQVRTPAEGELWTHGNSAGEYVVFKGRMQSIDLSISTFTNPGRPIGRWPGKTSHWGI